MKGSGVPWGLGREGEKKTQQNFRGDGFQIQTQSCFIILGERKNSFWIGPKKKAFLQAFSIRLFLDETILVKLYTQKISF